MSEENDDDKSQKNLDPTDRRLEKAREKGQVSLSKEVGHSAVLLCVIILLIFWFPTGMHRASHDLSTFFSMEHAISMDGLKLLESVKETLLDVLLVLIVPFLFLSLAAIASALLQTQLLTSWESLTPKLSKISIFKGIKRLFSANALVEVIKSVVKVILIVSICIWVLRPLYDKGTLLPFLPMAQVMSLLNDYTLVLFLAVFSFMAALALMDFFYQKYHFKQNLKMSRQDIKDEQKESDGDPHLKQHLYQIRRERVNRKLAEKVESATVVVTNPTHYSIVLRYTQSQDNAPVVVAKGVDHLALHIRVLAKKYDVPILEDAPLARALHAGVEEGEEISVEYYEAVAKIIRYVLKLNKSA